MGEKSGKQKSGSLNESIFGTSKPGAGKIPTVHKGAPTQYGKRGSSKDSGATKKR